MLVYGSGVKKFLFLKIAEKCDDESEKEEDEYLT